MTSTIPDATSLQGVVDYSYDGKRQLTKEVSDRVSGYSYANAFDGAGNATTFRNDPHTYNDDNQLTGPGTYVYDGNGNPTTFGGTSLSFDVENRMTGYGTALTAGYRGDGLRAWKQPGGGNKTYFLYDGISVLCELDDTGAVSASSAYGVFGLLSRATSQFQYDPFGDAVLLLDDVGAVAAYQAFDAWGTPLISATGPFGYRAQFGYFFDGESGLMALAFRAYSPTLGRFINRDPIAFEGGANLYSYVAGTPTADRDASGLFPALAGLALLVAALEFVVELCRAPGQRCLANAIKRAGAALAGLAASAIAGLLFGGWPGILIAVGAGFAAQSVAEQLLDAEIHGCRNASEPCAGFLAGAATGASNPNPLIEGPGAPPPMLPRPPRPVVRPRPRPNSGSFSVGALIAAASALASCINNYMDTH